MSHETTGQRRIHAVELKYLTKRPKHNNDFINPRLSPITVKYARLLLFEKESTPHSQKVCIARCSTHHFKPYVTQTLTPQRIFEELRHIASDEGRPNEFQK